MKILKALCALTFLLSGCAVIDAINANPDSSDYRSTARYEVVTTGCEARITYQVGGATQQAQAASGWNYEFKYSGTGQFLYVSAQNTCDSGQVTVTISARNYAETEFTQLFAASSDTPYGVATASGSSGSY